MSPHDNGEQCVLALDIQDAKHPVLLDQQGCKALNVAAAVPKINPDSFRATDKYSVQLFQENNKSYFFLISPDPRLRDRNMTLVSVNPAESLISLFSKQSYISNFLVANSGTILIHPKGFGESNKPAEFSENILEKINQKQFKQGTFESRAKTGDDLLVSFSFIDSTSLFVVSVADKSLAFRALLPLLIKCGIAFVALVFFSIFISLIISKKLTRGIEILRDSMKKFGFGELNATANIFSIDEIGELAKYFNEMTGKIRRLIAQSEEKVAIEKELATAKRVQETLLPANYMKSGRIEIAGYYEPATECGGDWWYYFEIGSKLYLCIGDVTGHGVPSALMTSAARATISFLSRKKTLTPSEILQHMNNAIHDCSHGDLQMTFFAAMIDQETLELTYANGSHEPPMLFPKIDTKIKVQDINFLNGAEGHRIGEDLGSIYHETSMILDPGDRLFFYTDGITAVANREKKYWPEREIKKALIRAFTTNQRTLVIIEDFKESLNKHRQNTLLEDDLTFFMVSFNS